MAMTGLNEQEALMGFNPKDALLSVVASAVLALTGAFVSVSADASPNNCDDPLVRCSPIAEPQTKAPMLGTGGGYYEGLGGNSFGLGAGYGEW